MNMSISSTNSPNLVTLTISPAKSSPTRSSMNFTFFHSISSRSASSARRSDWLDSSAMSCSVSSGIGPPRGARGALSFAPPFPGWRDRRLALRPRRRGLAVSDLSRADSDAVFSVFGGIAQHVFQDTVNDEVGIAPDGRSEMRINRSGQREVALVDLGVARLLQGAQHQVRQDALFRFARNLLRQLLIHARGNVHFLGDLDDVRIAPAAMAVGPPSPHCHALHW